jgi:hypothetical protein
MESTPTMPRGRYRVIAQAELEFGGLERGQAVRHHRSISVRLYLRFSRSSSVLNLLGCGSAALCPRVYTQLEELPSMRRLQTHAAADEVAQRCSGRCHVPAQGSWVVSGCGY